MPGFWERMDRNPLPKYRSKSCHKIDQIVQLSCFFMLRLWEIGGGGLQQKRASYLLPHLISISPSLSSSSRLFPAHSLSLVQSHSHHHLCTVGVFSFGSFIEFLKWVWNCGWPQYRDRDSTSESWGQCRNICDASFEYSSREVETPQARDYLKLLTFRRHQRWEPDYSSWKPIFSFSLGWVTDRLSFVSETIESHRSSDTRTINTVAPLNNYLQCWTIVFIPHISVTRVYVSLNIH